MTVLLDTSVLIARVPNARGPTAGAAISVISVGELHAGVRLARDDEQRAVRADRLREVRAAFAAVPVDEVVAEHYGEVLARARTERRLSKATDLLIIASAGATRRTLITLDQSQAELAGRVGVAARSEL